MKSNFVLYTSNSLILPQLTDSCTNLFFITDTAINKAAKSLLQPFYKFLIAAIEQYEAHRLLREMPTQPSGGRQGWGRAIYFGASVLLII